MRSFVLSYNLIHLPLHIGGACGGLAASLLHVGATAYGITGLFGFLITTSCAAAYALVMAVAAGVAFALSWVLYKE